MKRAIKCIPIFLIVAVLLFASTACGDRSKVHLIDDADMNPEYLSIFSSDSMVGSDVAKYWSDRFTERYKKNIYVNFDGAEYYADENLSYRELLVKRLESSAPDDLYIISAEDVLEFEKRGYWMDLSDMDFVDNLSPSALYQSTYNGKVFSVPLSFTGFGFAWNVDLLGSVGASIPQNLSEFMSTCEKLKNAGILPYGANKGFALTVPAMCTGFSALYGSADSDARISALNVDTPVSEYMRSGYAFLADMISRGYLDPEQALAATPRKDDVELFMSGNCGFICIGLGNLPVQNPSFAWELTGLPVLEGGSAAVYGADTRLCVNPKAKHLDTALDFVEMVGTPEALAQSARLENVMSSAKTDAKTEFGFEQKLVDVLRTAGQVPNQDFALHFNTWESIRDVGRELCAGASVDEACALLDARQERDLASYGE